MAEDGADAVELALEEGAVVLAPEAVAVAAEPLVGVDTAVTGVATVVVAAAGAAAAVIEAVAAAAGGLAVAWVTRRPRNALRPCST